MPESNNNTTFLKLFSLTAGTMDSCTGLLLIFTPSVTLNLMRINPAQYPSELIQFIGAFVFAVGSTYLWALGWTIKSDSWQVLLYTWLGTAWIRICVGCVTGLLIFKGQLSSAWVTVPMVDLAFAGIQINRVVTEKFPTHE
jgi:hypothetical protein